MTALRGPGQERTSGWPAITRPDPRRLPAVPRLAVTVVLAWLVVGGCGQAGVVVARRICDSLSPLIVAVAYSPANILASEEVHVYLVTGTTQAQQDEFWRLVIAPAGGAPYGSVGITNVSTSVFTFRPDDAIIKSYAVCAPGR